MNIGKRRNEEQLPYSDVWELYKKVGTKIVYKLNCGILVP